MNPVIPFQTTSWSSVPFAEHAGVTGVAHWKTVQYPGLRIRMVEYSPNYLADHWCEKGHIIYCIEGEMDTLVRPVLPGGELADGSIHKLSAGMSYQVSDGMSSHRTSSKNGVKLFIVDGDFLK